MKPLLLINPNTNVVTTQEMVEIARKTAPVAQAVEGVTVLRGSPLIYDDEMLSVSASAVAELAKTLDLNRYSGIIVAAFGDPGIDALRRLSPVPVTGIAEAGIIEAAGNGRRFSIVTTTPDLVCAIHKRVEGYGYGDAFTGVRLTEGDVIALMSDPARLENSLMDACAAAIADDGAEAIIIGGGPLAVHAVALSPRFSVPIIEPVPAAVRLVITRAQANTVEAAAG
ncbi:aspartate/glutamate racemase family protein [Pararhizobium sp. YC-54]|uniref:aspartate/glutamate racemase family protein n=1 Tax=Pararhizobium sp. YC-54 TaxID=2986920 RepID=UPI0021F7B8D1|nr:aspartate/glutamate racemase family protein [Pararhizobium sp. YC-54]MCW0000989.1 aspartate/glutamate racemase family protein [Pararhizobium sp. YC-54]